MPPRCPSAGPYSQLSGRTSRPAQQHLPPVGLLLLLVYRGRTARKPDPSVGRRSIPGAQAWECLPAGTAPAAGADTEGTRPLSRSPVYTR